MLIADGFDNTGKTTLVKRLAEEFGLTYLHSPSEYKNRFDLMVNWAITELGSKKRAIYDRFSPITDQVYGPVLRGGTPYLNDKRAMIVVELLKNTPHLIIYTRPSRQRIFQFGEREQMNGVIEQAEKLLSRYDQLMIELHQKGFNIIRYNYEDNETMGPHSLYYVAKHVEEFIKQHLS